MSRLAVMTVAKRAGLWSALVGVVFFFTLIFTFLGTLTTAVLAGMMAGAMGRWRWEFIPVSLVFPGVLLALGQTARTDLELRQRVSLAGLCCGAFWAAHLFTFLLMKMEKKSVPSKTDASSSSNSASVSKERPRLESDRETSPPLSLSGHEVSLGDLEGRWFCEGTGRNGQQGTKLLEIVDGRFALSTTAGEGPKLLVQGRVRVDDKELVISSNPHQS